jgi:hypothetical protein
MEASKVNFIQLDTEKLVYLLDYLGFENFLRVAGSHKKIMNDDCVTEIKYSDGYDILIVKPNTISFINDPYPEKVFFTAENYAKLWKVFN